ncbi:MAG: hypothetical protein ACREOV_08030, partial [Candidatus Dormibacteraceae bacterium]
PTTVAPDRATAVTLLQRGYALAGGTYSAEGWAVAQAVPEQLALLSLVRARWHPHRILLWGESMGGLITALLAEEPAATASGALALCGVVEGTTLQFSRWLVGAVAFQQLVAGGDPRLRPEGITDPGSELRLARSYLALAQETPAGRARVALAATLAGVPGWYSGSQPRTVAAMEVAQARWLNSLVLFFEFDASAELARRAGGNGTSTDGVDDAAVLAASPSAPDVAALYRVAGLSLSHDLVRLARVPPIAPDAGAARYLGDNGTPGGHLRVPTLTVQTVGDGLVSPADDVTLAQRVAAAGDPGRLRQLYVQRAGHCTFTPSELVTAVGALDHRVTSGSWPALEPAALNLLASGLGGATASKEPAFMLYRPRPSRY